MLLIDHFVDLVATPRNIRGLNLNYQNEPKQTINYAGNAVWTRASVKLTKKGAEDQRLSKIKKLLFE